MTGATLASERLSVLVVEDNPADADLVREMLRDAKFVATGAVTPEIHHVETLRGALAVAKQPFDVALLDLGLPDANGLEGLSALNAAVPQLPAVVLTSALDPALAARALVAGAQDFLVKGEVQGDLLLRSLRFAVARQRRAARQRQIVSEQDVNGSGGRSALHDGSLRRVLLVEDNPGDAELVRVALAQGSSGFTVHHVERLGDALAHLSSGGADVVLLDLDLPDAAGMECVAKMRTAFPELPVVVLTGNASAGLEAMRAGVQDYVSKGELEPHGLQRAIEYAIERNAHARRARELAAERANHAATQAAAKMLEDANQRLALATRQANDALEQEAAARAQAERRQQEVEALFASMIDPVLVYGQDHHIESSNPAAREFFGVDVRGLLPAGLIEVAGIRSKDGAKLAVDTLPASLALDGAIAAGEKLRVRTPGGERVVLVSASPLWRGDAVRGALCVYRDVTERDRAEQALRENDERKTQFLAMLSHELRNPLAPILNSLYILARAAPGGEQARRALAVIDRQVHHVTRLVDDLLDVTRITRGKVRLQRERLDLRSLAHRTAEDHRELFAKNGVELDLVAADEVVVNADSTRIAQMMGNLLQNSVKFTPRGGRTTLSVERTDGFGLITVRDTGAGIAREVMPDLFQPFVQAEKTLDRSAGGLGLGLALVKGLVELHGGRVSAHSEGVGKGATFVVRLPLERRRTQRSTVVPARPAPGPTRRVLVIEDNTDSAETLKEALELNDHVVAIAMTGPDGIEKARSFKPDVVLCDIGLPGMDGFQVARTIRSDPHLRGIPLIALSGYAQPEDLERSREAGFDLHLAKPPELDTLERAIVQARANSSESLTAAGSTPPPHSD